MSAPRTARRAAAPAAVLAALLAAACTTAGAGTRARSTLVIGIDVSGSFRQAGLYDDAVQFAARYIYAHLHGLGGLPQPSALFVGSLGGARAGDIKPFHPINDFQDRTIEQIEGDLRAWYPDTDPYTDFNAFFKRTAEVVKERGLILAPLNVVVLSDGVPDVPPGTRLARGESPYARIDLSPLEYLSRSVTVRLLYASPSVGENWKRQVKRKRVRFWSEEAQVMAGWHRQASDSLPPEQQAGLWKWVADNVDLRVRMSNLF